MQANDLLEYINKIIKAFKDHTFMSKHLKKSDDAAYDYVLKYVNKSIEKIKSMEEKINLSLFEDFFKLSPVNFAKQLINTKNANENKEIVEEIKNRILCLEDRIKIMSEKEKKDKNAYETLKIIRKILGQNKDAQNFFHRASKVDKGKSESKIEESIAERTKLRRQKLNTIVKICIYIYINNELFDH